MQTMNNELQKIVDRYEDAYNIMATSKDPKKMIIFGNAERWAFPVMAELAPDKALKWLEMVEPAKWNNYVSRSEADAIARSLVNQDGSKGPHWPYEAFKAAVESLGVSMSEAPFYNCYALWLTAQMQYSDHAESAKEFVPERDLPKYFYLTAVENLKDVDRPHFIREYFDL